MKPMELDLLTRAANDGVVVCINEDEVHAAQVLINENLLSPRHALGLTSKGWTKLNKEAPKPRAAAHA